jgi:hypothetical protein
MLVRERPEPPSRPAPSPLSRDRISVVLCAVDAVNSFLFGVIRKEISESRAERATGMSEAQRQAAVGPYLSRMLVTGRYPALDEVVRDATHPDADTAFDTGLDCLLDGIAARFAR